MLGIIVKLAGALAGMMTATHLLTSAEGDIKCALATKKAAKEAAVEETAETEEEV